MTFGFVGRAGDAAGLRGAGFQATVAKPGSAEIGWDPSGTVPHFVPQRYLHRLLGQDQQPRPGWCSPATPT